MKRIRLALAALLLAGAFVGIAVSDNPATTPVTGEAEPAAAFQYQNYSACTQSFAYRERVCYDTGDKWFYIYAGPSWTQPSMSFPSNSGYSGIGQFSTNAFGVYNCNNFSTYIDEIVWNGATTIHIGSSSVTNGCTYVVPGYHMGIYNQACYDGQQQICVYGGNFNYLVWYSATRGFDFVFTTS